MSERRVELRIEELVLSGFDGADGGRIAAATRAELERLGRGAPEWRPEAAPSVRAAPIPLAPGAEPGALGQAIARSVFGGLGS